MNKLTYEKLKRIDSEYNALKVLLLIIKIRFSKANKDKEKYKMELFLMMAKVIVKNIENFWYLAKPHRYAHHIIETTELISECYIALEISIKNFGARKTGNVRYNVFQIKPGTEDEYIYDYSTNLGERNTKFSESHAENIRRELKKVREDKATLASKIRQYILTDSTITSPTKAAKVIAVIEPCSESQSISTERQAAPVRR
jgi:hypothetical protein